MPIKTKYWVDLAHFSNWYTYYALITVFNFFTATASTILMAYKCAQCIFDSHDSNDCKGGVGQNPPTPNRGGLLLQIMQSRGLAALRNLLQNAGFSLFTKKNKRNPKYAWYKNNSYTSCDALVIFHKNILRHHKETRYSKNCRFNQPPMC